MGIFIGVAMAKGLGAGIVRITQVLGHAATGAAAHIVARTGYAHIGCVALGRVGNVAHCLGQRNLRLRPADEVGCLCRCIGDDERLWVR